MEVRIKVQKENQRNYMVKWWVNCLILPNFKENHPKLSKRIFIMVPNSLQRTYAVKNRLNRASSILNGKSQKKFSHFTNLEVKKHTHMLHQQFTVVCGPKNSLFIHQSFINQFQKGQDIWNPETPSRKKAYMLLKISTVVWLSTTSTNARV